MKKPLICFVMCFFGIVDAMHLGVSEHANASVPLFANINGVTQEGVGAVNDHISEVYAALDEDTKRDLAFYAVNGTDPSGCLYGFWRVVGGFFAPLTQLSMLMCVLVPTVLTEGKTKQIAEIITVVCAATSLASGKIHGYASGEIRKYEDFLLMLRAMRNEHPLLEQVDELADGHPESDL
jgi:hypothetical protein